MNTETDCAGITDISEDRSRARLQSHTFGRLVVRVGDIIDVFPVNYWSDGYSIVFRTAPGTKLAAVAAANEVLFEIDEVGIDLAWSVVARGSARLLESEAELADAVNLPLAPLAPNAKKVFVEITAERVTGREFVPTSDDGPEPGLEMVS